MGSHGLPIEPEMVDFRIIEPLIRRRTAPDIEIPYHELDRAANRDH